MNQTQYEPQKKKGQYGVKSCKIEFEKQHLHPLDPCQEDSSLGGGR
jgi:hypothetical protein